MTAAAFRDADYSAPPAEPGGDPGEVALIDSLRDDSGWMPELSLVAVDGELIVGHVVGSRAWLGDSPAVGLGPLSVSPERQKAGVGSALMHAILGAADALGESIVGLLGEPSYYARFGFVPAALHDVKAPDISWGEYFQVRTLTTYGGAAGLFSYAAPFEAV
ncbi:N-acetyltransferase [Gordonia sp. HY442]|uniref:GNAT family N-acetyltransferase n=1 Tax=Gordonia zhenghanii TaxID=2911516 RepID=UPI001EEFBA82|nr:N-acetyltransferase [Gordonia zhenghanii]MCF8607749.1 N-acetyltransferase [Gordonia zhenghanii]